MKLSISYIQGCKTSELEEIQIALFEAFMQSQLSVEEVEPLQRAITKRENEIEVNDV